jgi:DNA-binding response OmpR family regulator
LKSGGRVLVVENYSDLLMMISATLVRRNFRCDAVKDPATAIEKLRDDGYASILLDIVWPVTTNPVIEFLRNERPDELKKLIIMTGFDPRYVGLEDLSGICTFLQKPFDIDTLLERIEHCRKG